IPYCHHHIRRRRSQRFGKHVSLVHHDEDALEPERESTRWNVLTQEHAHEVVVAPAAPKTAREMLHIDLHDRARVVRKSTRQSGIYFHSLPDTHRLRVIQYRLQLIDALRAQFIVFHKLDDATKHGFIERLLRILFGHDLSRMFELSQCRKEREQTITRRLCDTTSRKLFFDSIAADLV